MNDNNLGENQNENEHDINAININNNQNNINQNQINNQDNNTFNIFSKFPEITISYLIFLIINIIIFIYSQFLPLEKTTFVFQYRPVTSKNQLYRLITRYFIHFGFAHLILEQVTFFYLTKYFESKFGTLLTLSIIFVSMILVSIINILIIPIFSLFLSYRVSILLDHAYEGGLTPVIFAMVTYFSLFKKNRHERLLLNNFFLLRVKYSYLYLLGILYFFTPNRSFYGNVSGIFGGFILKKYRNIFLPKLIWIFDLEKNSCLNHIKNLYKKININNNEMINMLKEYDKDSLDDIIFNYQIMNTNGDK
jgi:membrane associated rhomboid family serine protease